VTLHAAPVTVEPSVVGLHTHVLLIHVPFPLQNCPPLLQGAGKVVFGEGITVMQQVVVFVLGLDKSVHVHTPVLPLHTPLPQHAAGQVFGGGAGTVILQAGPRYELPSGLVVQSQTRVARLQFPFPEQYCPLL